MNILGSLRIMGGRAFEIRGAAVEAIKNVKKRRPRGDEPEEIRRRDGPYTRQDDGSHLAQHDMSFSPTAPSANGGCTPPLA